MGDPNVETESNQCVGKEYGKAIVKTIKFKEHPQIDDTIKQVEALLKEFVSIVEKPQSLVIRLSKTKGAPKWFNTFF